MSKTELLLMAIRRLYLRCIKHVIASKAKQSSRHLPCFIQSTPPFVKKGVPEGRGDFILINPSLLTPVRINQVIAQLMLKRLRRVCIT
jgi:hypothetical protein